MPEAKIAEVEIQYDAYAKQKYPGITLEEMQEKLLRLRLLPVDFTILTSSSIAINLLSSCRIRCV